MNGGMQCIDKVRRVLLKDSTEYQSKTPMNINLRDIITHSELMTLKELSGISDDDNEAYNICVSRWQSVLDASIEEQTKKQNQIYADFRKSIASFTKRLTGLLTIGLASYLLFVVANSCVHELNLNSREVASERITAGFFKFGVRTGSNQIKDAPSGVTLESLQETEVEGFWQTKKLLVFVLNMPKLPSEKIYAVTYELIVRDAVHGTGLFHTKSGESGLLRFEKIHPHAPAGFEWIRISVKILDVGSVPASK